MESAQFCGQCGARIAATEKFCTACGSPRELVEGLAVTAPAVPADREESQVAKNKVSPAAPKPVDLPGVSAESAANPKGLLTSGVVYVLVYLILAVPTYVLPYFGSNSSVLNVFGAATGLGALPQFWFHLVALYLLVVVAWIRGGHIGKQWLAIFPVLAAIFDMVPGFSVIPLLPTIFHVLALVVGVSGKLVAADDAVAGKRRIVLSAIGFAAVAILALAKTQTFFLNAQQGPSWEQHNAQQQPSHEMKVPSPAQHRDNTRRQDSSSSTSINHLQNLRTSCASDTRYACVWIAETTSSTCKKLDQCANSMTNTLHANDLTFTTNDNNDPYDNSMPDYQPGCVGYRSDIGGTKEGAVALVKLLGEAQYYVDDSKCRVAGFKYNVIRR